MEQQAGVNADDVGAVASATIAGEVNRCPHCAAQSIAIEHPQLRYVCGVCGGPRIPVKDVRAHTALEKQHLVAADQARKSAFGLRMASTGLALTGTLLAALCAVLATVSLPVGVVLAFVAVAAFVLAVSYGRRARRALDDAKRAALAAWETVAETVLRVHGGDVSKKEMATLLGTNEAEAERVMTVLAVDDRVRVDIGKDAELRYRVPEAAPAEDAAFRALERTSDRDGVVEQNGESDRALEQNGESERARDDAAVGDAADESQRALKIE